jgi:hypothetical protein
MLILKTPRGDDTEIAPFAARTEAIDALMAVSRALEKAHGHIRPFSGTSQTDGNSSTAGSTSRQPARGFGKWIAVILGIVLLLILFNVWGALLPRPAGGLQPLEPAQLDQLPPPADTGVPISADDFLKTQ